MKRALVVALLPTVALVVGARAEEQAVEPAEPAGEHSQAIRELLELTGAANLSEQIMNQMLQPMKAAMPAVPDEFWDELIAEFDTEGLVEMVVPIYTKHLTLDEVKQLNEFYRSPIGRRLVEVQPAIVQESMEVGMRWGFEKSKEIMERLKQAGYTPEA